MSDDEIRKLIATAFRAGADFVRDRATVSEHDGWHRVGPFIEFPHDGVIRKVADERAERMLDGVR